MIERALIIGGTGMLADTSRWVAKHARQTVLAARHPEALAAELGAVPWKMDWRDQCSGLSTLVPMPEFSLVLAWLHQDGLWLAGHLQAKLAKGGRFVHIHPGVAENPAVLAKRAVSSQQDPAPQNIILGRITEGSRKRWLTKAEINTGVISALRAAPEARTLIGDPA